MSTPPEDPNNPQGTPSGQSGEASGPHQPHEPYQGQQYPSQQYPPQQPPTQDYQGQPHPPHYPYPQQPPQYGQPPYYAQQPQYGQQQPPAGTPGQPPYQQPGQPPQYGQPPQFDQEPGQPPQYDQSPQYGQGSGHPPAEQNPFQQHPGQPPAGAVPPGYGGPGYPPQMPQDPAGNGGGKKKTGLIVGLSVGAVALLGGTAALIWFLTSGGDYPDRPLTVEEIENLYPEEGEGAPAGFEPTDSGNVEEGDETWGEHLDSLENDSWFEDYADDMRGLIGDVDGAETCVDAIEAQHEFLVNHASNMDPDALSYEASGWATFASDDAEIDVYITTYEDDLGTDNNPWLDRIAECEPVEAEQRGDTSDVEVIEEGSLQGYSTTRDDRTTVLLYSTYGDHLEVEFYATSDSLDAEALEDSVREFMELLEAELAEIED